MKIEIEISAFGGIEVHGTEDAYKAIELMRVHKLSKDTTLGEVENGYNNPEQCVGKITIRAKKENGEIVFLG